MDSHVPSSPTGSWTNEKHVHYLNSMEASFVRTMFENDGRFLLLDRYMPDSSESTLDLKSQRRKKHNTSDIFGSKARRDGRRDKRTRRRSSRQYTSSQDQVVPQIGNITGDKDEYVPVAPNAPAN